MALPTRSPSQAQALALWEERIQRRTRVCLPVEVQSYDANTQTVSVKPDIQDTYLDENGVTQTEVLQVLSGVPVQFSRGGTMRITFPVKQGDTGIIIMADRSLDLWLGLSTPADTAPTDARRHHLADAVYVPGVNVQGQAWSNADPDVITVGDDTASSSDFAALANKVLTQLDNIVTAFNQHVHLAQGPTSPTNAPTAVPTVIPIPTPTSVASATVKIYG